MKKLLLHFLFCFISQFASAQTLIPYLKMNGKTIFVDSATMKPVIEKEFDYAFRFEEGLAAVSLNSKYGYIDKTGKEIIEFKYDNALPFKQGQASVVLNKQNSLIDKTGKEVFPFKYQYINDFNEGLAVAILNDKYGYIDKTGKEIIPCQYDNAQNFNEGLAKVKLNNKCGYINKTGNIVIPLKYDDGFDFLTGIAIVRLNKKYGCIDKKGKEIIPPKYDNIGNSSFGDLLSVAIDSGQSNYRWGFIDKTGKPVIPLLYTKTSSEFFNGIAIVNKDGQIQLINKKKEKLTALDNYDDFDNIKEGLVFVKLKKNMPDAGKYTIINMQGKEITSSRFDKVGIFNKGTAGVKSNGKWGFIDKTGNLFIPFKYSDYNNFNNGMTRVKLEGKWFFIDRAGREYRDTLPLLATGWLFYDEFIDNRNNWGIDSTSNDFQTVLRSSGFDIWNRRNDQSRFLLRKIKNFNEKDNYRIEITIKYTGAGPDNMGNGMIIGCDEKISNYYRFMLNKNGDFRIDESIVGLIVPLQDWKVSNNILKYGNNKLGFTHFNGQWKFYINEYPVFEYKAKELPGPEIGVFIGPGSSFYCKTFNVYDWTKAATDPNAPKEPLYETAAVDDFTSNRYNSWATADDNQTTAWFTTTAYRIKSKSNGYFMPSEYFSEKDMIAHRVELEVRHKDGVEDYGFGLCFGKKDVDNACVFCISADGSFHIMKNENGNWSDIKEWTASDAIKQGNNLTNKLRFENDHGKWNFYINDKLVYSRYASKLPGKQFGCYVENKQTAEFTWFKFTRITYPD